MWRRQQKRLEQNVQDGDERYLPMSMSTKLLPRERISHSILGKAESLMSPKHASPLHFMLMFWQNTGSIHTYTGSTKTSVWKFASYNYFLLDADRALSTALRPADWSKTDDLAKSGYPNYGPWSATEAQWLQTQSLYAYIGRFGYSHSQDRERNHQRAEQWWNLDSPDSLPCCGSLIRKQSIVSCSESDHLAVAVEDLNLPQPFSDWAMWEFFSTQWNQYCQEIKTLDRFSFQKIKHLQQWIPDCFLPMPLLQRCMEYMEWYRTFSPSSH